VTSVINKLVLGLSILGVLLIIYAAHSIKFFEAVAAEMIISTIKATLMYSIYLILYKIRIHYDPDFNYAKVIGYEKNAKVHYLIQSVIILIIIIIAFW